MNLLESFERHDGLCPSFAVGNSDGLGLTTRVSEKKLVLGGEACSVTTTIDGGK